MSVRWIVEADVFGDDYLPRMKAAVEQQGHQLTLWDDAWWDADKLPCFSDSRVIFHGSLANAALISAEFRYLPLEAYRWSPGAYCDDSHLAFSAWTPHLADWGLNQRYDIVPAKELVSNPGPVLARLGNPERVFVRPDSPLKQFSGRVLPVTGLTLEALDHGFYYEDDELLVVVAPAQDLMGDMEWRFVIVHQTVVAGSAYDPATRLTVPEAPMPTGFAQKVAGGMYSPEPVYVMDVCHTDQGFRVIELNPFSGADMYGCDLNKVVKAVSEISPRV